MTNYKRQQRLMSPSTMLSYNLSIVLQTIKTCGPISRADIARQLGSSKSTISSSIATLEELELVREVGNGSPRTGRKSILLAFNPTAHFFGAVDLRWKKVNLALVDMEGRIHAGSSYQRVSTKPESLIRKMTDRLDSLIKTSKIEAEKIEALGIMVPGIVDTEKGIVCYSSTLGWKENVDFAGPIQKYFDKPVTIYNDANALALGEMWKGCGNIYPHLGFIYIAGGVGGACINEGKIILGADSAAGEFGKLLVTDKNAARQAETFLSLPSMLSLFADTENLEYEQALDKTLSLIKSGRLFDSDRKMIDVIVDKMAQVVVSITAVFNPQAIIINCSYLSDSDTFLDRLRAKVLDYLPQQSARTLNLLKSCLNEESAVLGAAAAAISRSRFHFVLQDVGPVKNGQEYLM